MDNRTLDYQIEVVQVSIYYDLIRRIIFKFRSLSIIKIAVISFVIKKREYLQGSIYSARNTNDLVLKFLSQASGLYDDLCNQFKYIIEAIDILVVAGECEVHEGELICDSSCHQIVKGFDGFTEAAIRETTNYSDRQFLREVVSIV